MFNTAGVFALDDSERDLDNRCTFSRNPDLSGSNPIYQG